MSVVVVLWSWIVMSESLFGRPLGLPAFIGFILLVVTLLLVIRGIENREKSFSQG